MVRRHGLLVCHVLHIWIPQCFWVSWIDSYIHRLASLRFPLLVSFLPLDLGTFPETRRLTQATLVVRTTVSMRRIITEKPSEATLLQQYHGSGRHNCSFNLQPVSSQVRSRIFGAQE